MGKDLSVAPAILSIAFSASLAHADAMAVAIGNEIELLAVPANGERMAADTIRKHIFPHLPASHRVDAAVGGRHFQRQHIAAWRH